MTVSLLNLYLLIMLLFFLTVQSRAVSFDRKACKMSMLECFFRNILYIKYFEECVCIVCFLYTDYRCIYVHFYQTPWWICMEARVPSVTSRGKKNVSDSKIFVSVYQKWKKVHICTFKIAEELMHFQISVPAVACKKYWCFHYSSHHRFHQLPHLAQWINMPTPNALIDSLSDMSGFDSLSGDTNCSHSSHSCP